MSSASAQKPEQDLRYDLFGHACASAIGGRLYSFEQEPGADNHAPALPYVNLFIPNSSCSLPITGGRARSRIVTPTDIEINGVWVAGVQSIDVEVFDRRSANKVTTHARVRIEGFQVGLDERLSIELSDFELVSEYDGKGPARFAFRKKTLKGVEYAGHKIDLEIGDPPRDPGPDRGFEVRKTVRQCKFDRNYPGVQQRQKLADNQIDLPNLGVASFGDMIVTANSWRFTLLRLRLGCPSDGTIVTTDVLSNGHP
jgi:hypothetical protein